MSELNIDLKKFAENAKKIKNVKIDFVNCLNAEIYQLEEGIKNLFGNNEQLYIFNELSKLDINTITVSKIGRLQTILKYVSQEYLKKYMDNFLATNSLQELPEAPKRPEVGSDKTLIEEFNTSVRLWKEETAKIKEWNTKFSTLTEYLNSIVTVDLYGDITINVDNLPYVYFKFFNTDIDEIEVFMQELKTCPAPPVKNIKTIRIEDISAKLPDFLKSANEVRVYFDTEAEAEELHGSKDYVEGVYEKYVIKNDTMKKDGGEWGMYNQRKDNLGAPVVGGFSLSSMSNPVNLNSGDDEEEESEFYKKDYEVNLSDCYFANTTHNGEKVYAIVPKDFWEELGTLLVNPNMFIVGISDNRKWRKEDIYFKSYSTDVDAEDYLDDNAEYSDELYQYMASEEYEDEKEDVSVLSPFKQVIKKIVNTPNFNDGWEWKGDAEMYNLSSVKNFPTCQDLYDKLSLSSKKTMWGFYGFKNENDFLNKIELDEEQDFENCDIASFDDNSLTIRCGGDWQQPAFITFELVGNIVEVVDYYYDIDGIESNSIEADDEDEDDDIENDTNELIEVSTKDCYWTIDYMDNDSEFFLNITPKSYWKENSMICEEPLLFTDGEVKGYVIVAYGEGSYGIHDVKGNAVKTLLLINKIMKEYGFEFSTEIQSEYVDTSLNGKRVSYNDSSEYEYFKRATVEFAEYLYNIDVEEDTSNLSNDNNEIIASDIKYAFGIDIHNNDIYLNMFIDSDFPELDTVNKFIMKGYKLYEVDCEGSGLFSLLYENGNPVQKLSEVKLVIDKSGFAYSWDLQQEIDTQYCEVNSNDCESEKEYISSLKVKLGQ